MKKYKQLLAYILVILGWSSSYAEPTGTPDESRVQLIELAAPLDLADAEISAMAWCDEKLILVPQYPKRLGRQTGSKENHFYALEKSVITAYLDGKTNEALVAAPVLVNENKLRGAIDIFDGYEGIACRDNQMWLTIEAVNIFGFYKSYAVPADFYFNAEPPSISIRPDRIHELASQSGLRNSGDEALLLDGSRMISFHELNGSHLVEQAHAQWLDWESETMGRLSFPDVPYRITDVTGLDSDKRFWAINYKYQGDKFSRKAQDALADRYGLGASHQQYDNVERLLEFELTPDGVVLVERPPIQLRMETEGRNWEGLARLDNRGLLLVTDKHPATLFGFVPFQ